MSGVTAKKTKNWHVVPAAGGWEVRRSGNSRATSVHDTQAAAIGAARKIAQNHQSELVIHGRDGHIRSRDNYDLSGQLPAPNDHGRDKPVQETRFRITARVKASVQSVIEEAAAFLGVPLNSFVVSAAVEKASDVLASERTITLSHPDAEFLARLMENPPEPNAALLAAAARHKKMIRAQAHRTP